MFIFNLNDRAVATSLHVDGDRSWYLLTDVHQESSTYVVTGGHSPGTAPKHRCGYLNLNRHDWTRFNATCEFKFIHDITFEGIAAGWMLPPADVVRPLIHRFEAVWIGKDWMGRENPWPADEEVLLSLASTYSAFLDNLPVEHA
jgi:hypothetical protein